jgi:hypothetical protein
MLSYSYKFKRSILLSINKAGKTTKSLLSKSKKKLKDSNDSTCFELIGLSTDETSLLPL